MAQAGGHLTKPSDDAKALDASKAAAEIAVKVLVARVESEDSSRLSFDERLAWGLANRGSQEFFHGNQQLGEWFRDSAGRVALQRYIEIDPTRT